MEPNAGDADCGPRPAQYFAARPLTLTPRKSRPQDRPPASHPRRAREAGVSATALATLHGVTRETVRQWTVDGCPRRDDGRYMPDETITWRIRREVAKVRKDDGSGARAKPASEMHRKIAAEADLKELQVEQLRATLVPAELHAEIVGRIAGGFAAVAAGQLTRFEKKIVQATRAAQARVITQDIHRALMEGAQALASELEDAARAADEAAA